MANTAVVEPEAKAADEFAAGWNDPEFGGTEPEKADAAGTDDAATVAAVAADADVKDGAPAKADAAGTDAAGTDDAATAAAAGTDAEAEAAAAAAKEAAAATNANASDYKPDYAEAVAGIRRDTEQGFSRIEKLIEKREAPAVEPAKKTDAAPKRVDLAEFTGDKLKTRLEKVRDVAPEAAEAFEPIIEGLAGALGDSYKELDTVRATATDTRAATAQQAQFAPIESKHPGFQETIKGEEFLTWLDEQPGKVMRTAHNTNDPNEFSGILDQFAAREGSAVNDGANVETDTTKPDDVAAVGGDDDAARVEARREAARQPETRTTADRPLDKQRDLSDEEAFSKGWNDPEFDKR